MQERNDYDGLGGFFPRLGYAALLLLPLAGIAIGVGLGLSDADDALVTSKLEQEAADRKAFKPCDIEITQYGPGDRWISSHRSPATCATAAGAVPDHVLSMPVGKRERR